MPELHLLGTGAAVSDPHRTTTMLAVSDGASTLLVDCGGDVIQRVLAAGLELDSIDGLIVTHEHPDHVSGFPLFMEKLWLAGRRRPIPVYGIEAAIGQARRCFETFNTSGWKGLPEIEWTEVRHEEGAIVLDDGTWHVSATPVVHPVPIIGLRLMYRVGSGTVAYSCDTEPAEEVVRLSMGADILVHEATGKGPGHASAEEAADIASRAGVGRLLLVHLPPGVHNDDLGEARRRFSAVELGEELGAYRF
jgi:ribonuclease Z